MTKLIDLITILGPTATGKTTLAVNLARQIGGEIISADSRQVYRGMDIGTGKDLDEYTVDGSPIPYHLIDIVPPGHTYDLYRFVNDFRDAFKEIRGRGNQPILCGGSGMYLEAVIRGYQLRHVPVDQQLKEQLQQKSEDELIEMLKGMKQLHNVSDTSDRNRLIRAIEIERGSREAAEESMVASGSALNHFVIGIDLPREIIRARITRRLHERLNQGLVEEVVALLSSGITPEQLRYYGLEYRYVTDFCTGNIPYNEMVSKLNTAIHQFAKRQMTWFRRMEKNNVTIHWVNGMRDPDQLVEDVLGMLRN
jgi:tRNA dimethylallyltransferase